MSCIKSQLGFLCPLRFGDEVNFRLVYDGPLKAASQSDTRRIDKHAIRRVFNRQLWQLMDKRGDVFEREFALNNFQLPRVKRGPFNFIAIAREKLNLVCDLDILFLRRESPGQLLTHGGDLDNRIKVLFDALRIPQDENELRGLEPEGEEEMVFLCVAEDDKLITGFRVVTDRLLEPARDESDQNHVRLIINVELKITKLTEENMAYFSHF